ncbi:cell shape-determining protein MreC [Methylocaldum marinum]|uniref:Cell shape-determining protein MreC n=1 Tax=Methylocaldum marinum TaxID=1432792 RepID=A0A250KZP7_9GAMM|nr:cell shape-determining protein MreC [Methylocaldum marinum]
MCLAAAFVLLATEQHGLVQAARTPFASATYPLQQIVSTPVRLGQQVIESVSSYTNLVTENQKLREEQLLLKTKLLKFAALEQENIRLRGLLDTSFKVGEQVSIAELLSVNLVPYEHVVVVNKGSRLGVHAGQPVFDANGVVGQVLRVGPYSAEVMLITDPNHAIPVQVNRNGLRTLALGTGRTDRLALPYLSSNADIQVGDLLVTSGLGGVFPYGYPVATVTDVAPQKTAFAKVSAAPVAQLDRNRELLLVWSDSRSIPRIAPEQEQHPNTLPANGDR